MTRSEPNDPSRYLRRALRANAAFSATSGTLFALAGAPLATFLGVAPPLLVTSIGMNLWGFAAMLLWLASRSPIPAGLARIAVGADLAWVVGTAILVFADVLTVGGTLATLAVANVVLIFAVLQAIGIRRQSATGFVAAPERLERIARVAVGLLVGLPLLQALLEASVRLPVGPLRMLTIGLCAAALVPVALLTLARLSGGRLSHSASVAVACVVPLVAIAHLLGLARLADGPFGPVPGGGFRAENAMAPMDAKAAEGLRYAALEVGAKRPRTLETLVLVDDGAVYVAANMPEGKRWPSEVRNDGDVRIRLDGDAVYARRAEFVSSEEHAAKLLAGMVSKYGFDVSMGGSIWFFRLAPREIAVAR